MPLRYTNSFQPKTNVGTNLQNLANVLFTGKATPVDLADIELRHAQADAERIAAKEDLFELTQAEKLARERSDPNFYRNVASAYTGLPRPEVGQYLTYTNKGVPYARPNFNRGQEHQINSIVGNAMMTPHMPGDSTINQYSEAVGDMTGQGRISDVVGGNMDARRLAEIESGIKGEDRFKVTGGIGYDPFGGVSYESPAVQERARWYGAKADTEEQGGSVEPSHIAIPNPDDAWNWTQKLAQESNIELTEQEGQAVAERAGRYFSDPRSPHYKNMQAASRQAWQDVFMPGQEVPSSVWNPTTWGNDVPASVNIDRPMPGYGNIGGSSGPEYGMPANEDIYDSMPPPRKPGDWVIDDATGMRFYSPDGVTWLQSDT